MNIKLHLFIFILINFVCTNIYSADATTSVLGSTARTAVVGAVPGAAVGALKNKMVPKDLSERLGDFMASPTGIMVVSGIGGYNAYTLKQAASDQADECDANIQKIDMLLKAFKDSWAGKCPNGHENIEEPDCYCYTEKGAANPNRTNSDVCQKLWAQNNYKLSANSSNYRANLAKSDPVGCIASSGSFDQNCSCKRMVDSTGNNTCKKISSINMPSDGIGTAYLQNSGAVKLINTINNLTQGNIGLGNLNGRNLAIANARQNDINQALARSLFSQTKGGFKGFNSEAEVLKAQNSVFPPKIMASIGSSLGPSALASIGEVKNSEMDKAIKDVTKKTGLELNGSGGGLNNKKAQPNNGMNLNFGDPQAQNGNQANVDFGDKNYKLNKNSDIHKDNGASLFEIISNRYIQTGVTRLFEEPK